MEEIKNEDSVPGYGDVQDTSSSSSVEVYPQKLSGQFVTQRNDVILKLLKSNVHELKEGKKISLKRSTVSDLISKGLLVRVENKLCNSLSLQEKNSYSHEEVVTSSTVEKDNEIINNGNSTETNNTPCNDVPPDNGTTEQQTTEEREDVSVLKSPECKKMVSKASKKKSDEIKRLYLLRKTRSLILRKRTNACQNCQTHKKSAKFRKKIKSFHQKFSKKVSTKTVNSKATGLSSEIISENSLEPVVYDGNIFKKTARKSLKGAQLSLEKNNTKSPKKRTKKMKSSLSTPKMLYSEKASDSALQLSEVGKFCNEQSLVDLPLLSNEFVEEIENEVEITTEVAVKSTDVTVLGEDDAIINQDKMYIPENSVNNIEDSNAVCESFSKDRNEQILDSSVNNKESNGPKLYSLRECSVLLTRLETLPEFREAVMEFKNDNLEESHQSTDIDINDNIQTDSFNLEFLSNSSSPKKQKSKSEKLSRKKIKMEIESPTETHITFDELNAVSLDSPNFDAVETVIKLEENCEIVSSHPAYTPNQNLEQYVGSGMDEGVECSKEKTKKASPRAKKSIKSSMPKGKPIKQKSSSDRKKAEKSPLKKKMKSKLAKSSKTVRKEGILSPINGNNPLSDGNTIVDHRKLPEVLTVEQQVERKLNLVGIKLEKLSDYMDISHFLSLKERKPDCLLAIKTFPTSVSESVCQKFSFVVVEMLGEN